MTDVEQAQNGELVAVDKSLLPAGSCVCAPSSKLKDDDEPPEHPSIALQVYNRHLLEKIHRRRKDK